MFSDTQWSGALQSSSFDFTEIDGSGDSSVIFKCESFIDRKEILAQKYKKQHKTVICPLLQFRIKK